MGAPSIVTPTRPHWTPAPQSAKMPPMKLIIQIPCYNEADTLPQVLADLPTAIPGIDTIETLIIDDGSSDSTADLARQLGVDHVVRLPYNQGLARAFSAGLQACLDQNADLIVNTDGDNQYQGHCIPDLVKPLLAGQADIVVGARPIENISHFSWLKKKLQRLGSSVVRRFSGTEVPDTTSGFRAYTARAAATLHVFNKYTYTLETIIQAGAMGLRIANVPINVNPKTRESRLISSVPRYIRRSSAIILRSYITYKPLRTFFYFALLPGLAGLILCLRFLYFFFSGDGGHVQSLILAAILLIVAFQLFALGILGDLLATNRRLLQEELITTRRQVRQKPHQHDKPKV